MITIKHDVLIVGGGLAGIVSAIELAEKGVDVAIIYNQAINKSASSYAQGGIAAQVSKKDCVDIHIQDTYIASGETADLNSVTQVVNNSLSAIKWLEKHGVEFDQNESGEYSLHLEGGHSLARILHVKDYTGRAIVSKLCNVLKNNKKISIYSDHNVFELIKRSNSCVGLYSLNRNNEISKFLGKNVVLASGGASGIYKYVTNATAGTGCCMIMAHDIGCELKNLEFTQFHPTCFFGREGEPILISEAIRGSGAVLETKSGRRIMKSIHEQQDLAPRDIVARQIYINMQAGREIFLNATHLNGSQWQAKFPYIYEKLMENNIDPVLERIPISPAAHYSCGGVVVDKFARTQVENLYAVGEVSYTGLHGANRLASNSLLECVVYGLEASKDICSNTQDNFAEHGQILELYRNNSHEDYNEQILKIKQLMWDRVGLVRSSKQLLEALQELESLELYTNDSISETTRHYDFNLESYIKIIKLAKLTIQQAVQRKECVGSHYLRDSC